MEQCWERFLTDFRRSGCARNGLGLRLQRNLLELRSHPVKVVQEIVCLKSSVYKPYLIKSLKGNSGYLASACILWGVKAAE